MSEENPKIHDENPNGGLVLINGEKSPCNHGITFDDSGLNMDAGEVRRKWPRLFGPCPLGCGYNGIYYASWGHFIAGDW